MRRPTGSNIVATILYKFLKVRKMLVGPLRAVRAETVLWQRNLARTAAKSKLLLLDGISRKL
jgi:hypothetical protein